MKPFRTLALAAAAVLLALPVRADPTSKPAAPMSEKEKNIRKLLELTGAAKLGKQMLDTMADQFSQMPNIPPGFMEKLKELAKPDDLVELIIPIYMQNLDDQTVKDAVAFYSSPSGQKLSAAQPVMMRQTMVVARKWGQDLALRVIDAMRQEHAKDAADTTISGPVATPPTSK